VSETSPGPGHIPTSAIVLVGASTLCFATLDAMFKALSQTYPIPVLVWARWTVQALALLVWLAPSSGFAMVRTTRLTAHLFRGVVLISSSLCFFSALKVLPLAEATAINYATPALVTIMAVAFLDEKMTRARVAFVITGFAGVLLIVRPGSAMFQDSALFAIGAAWFYANFQILTRKLADEDWRALMFFPALVGSLTMTAILFFIDWPASIRWEHVALVIAGGLLGTFGHYLFLLAFQRAAASAVTPFTYVHLVWATLVGWVVFSTFPDLLALVGMAIITGSGLLIMLHEKRRSRTATPGAPTTID
jgi:drug/metabolite transporter (DMT)-like permease